MAALVKIAKVEPAATLPMPAWTPAVMLLNHLSAFLNLTTSLSEHTSSDTASPETDDTQECWGACVKDERDEDRSRLPWVLFHPFCSGFCDVDDTDLAQSFYGLIERATGFSTKGR
jgi:hypothetical protein